MSKAQIFSLVEDFFSNKKAEFIPGKTKIRVGTASIGKEETLNCLDSLLDGWVSQGEKVAKFEKNFAEYIGTKYAVAVNSGSSANLIALLASTKYFKISEKGKVITPAITFPTTVSPIIQAGLTPLIVDVDKKTYNLDLNIVEDILKKQEVSAIMPVHLLGNPVDVYKLKAIYSGPILEDVCEAHGAEINGKRVGSIGNLGTFSFFVAHNMTTGEGGMITTDNKEMAELSRSLRAFGRFCSCSICPVSGGKQCIYGSRFYSDDVLKNYDRRQLFMQLGYSMKMTDLQGALGIEQTKKLAGFNKKRIKNAEFYTKELGKFQDFLQLPYSEKNAKHVFYAYPIGIKKESPFDREELVNFLEKNQIETRPVFSGNIILQPAFRDLGLEIYGNLNVANWINDNVFFIGCHQDITNEQREYVVDSFKAFLNKY